MREVRTYLIPILFLTISIRIVWTKPFGRGVDCGGAVEGCKRIGDMIINTKINPLSGTKDYHWPNGEIPYDFHPDISNQEWKLDVINSAIQQLNTYLCVNFRPRVENDSVGVRIFDNPDFPRDCWSDVGFDPEFHRRNEGQFQMVVLGDNCSRPYGIGENKRTTVGTVMHELIHTLGFFHEHARDDRDRYVKIHYENIPEEDDNQFDYAFVASNGKEQEDYGVAYNYQSIMHYPPTARSHPPGTITIEATPPKDVPLGVGNPLEMGHECYLTSEDILMINRKYTRDSSCAKEVPTGQPPTVHANC